MANSSVFIVDDILNGSFLRIETQKFRSFVMNRFSSLNYSIIELHRVYFCIDQMYQHLVDHFHSKRHETRRDLRLQAS